MLAPAILAGGLLVGERTGYEAAEVVPGGASVEAEAAGLAFEPVYVPAPARADLTYEGNVPARRVRAPEVVAKAAKPVVREPEVVVRREARPPVRRVAEAACPGEWEETWLWELCREHERGPA